MAVDSVAQFCRQFLWRPDCSMTPIKLQWSVLNWYKKCSWDFQVRSFAEVSYVYFHLYIVGQVCTLCFMLSIFILGINWCSKWDYLRCQLSWKACWLPIPSPPKLQPFYLNMEFSSSKPSLPTSSQAEEENSIQPNGDFTDIMSQFSQSLRTQNLWPTNNRKCQ